MRLALIHNPTAGEGRPSPDELQQALRGAGFEVSYCTCNSDELGQVLEKETDVAMVAGGDGTVAKLARRISGRDVPLAILPLGIANNIAHSLGVEGLELHELPVRFRAANLQQMERTPLGIGVVRAPWGDAEFVEAAGGGVIGSLLHESAKKRNGGPKQASPNVEGKIEAGRQLLRSIIADVRPRHWRIDADGVDLSGEYVMVEALNTRMAGPRIALAPAAAVDGRLQLVLMREEDARGFLRQVLDKLDEPVVHLELPVYQVRKLRMGWHSSICHVDDKPWPALDNARASLGKGTADAADVEVTADVDLHVLDVRVEILVPLPRNPSPS